MRRTGVLVAGAVLLLLSGCTKEKKQTIPTGETKEEVTVTQDPTKTVVEEELTIQQISSMDLVKEMKIGWNLGNTLDAKGGMGIMSENAWGNPVTKKEMIVAIKDAGFNVIRIPVTWSGHITTDGTYRIHDKWMERVKEVVDYAYDEGLYVIINLHHEDDWLFPSYERQEEGTNGLTAIWTQIAETFKGYDEHLVFEGMNEPRMVGTSNEWNGGNQEGWNVINAWNQVFVDTVRATGGNNQYRHLMIPGYAASSTEQALKSIVVPDDERVIISVHGYLPYLMALSNQDVTEFDPENKNDTKDIDNLVQLVKELFIDKGTPVIVGEFGTVDKDNLDARIANAKYYITETHKIGVPCIWWDNNCFTTSGENLGLYDRRDGVWVHQEIVDAMMECVEQEELQ